MQQAREISEKLVTEAGLDGVADALREVEWKVKDALSHPTASVLWVSMPITRLFQSTIPSTPVQHSVFVNGSAHSVHDNPTVAAN
jgi:hypothetical protein